MENPEKTTVRFDFNPGWLARYKMPENAARAGFEVTAKDLAVMLAAYGKHNILCVDPAEIEDDVWVETDNSELLKWSGHDHRRAVEPMCGRLEESFCIVGAYFDNRDPEKVSFKIAPDDIREAHPESIDNPRVKPLHVDIRTVAGFRTVYSVPVYLRLLAWTYYPSLAPLRVDDEDGARIVTIARDEVAELLGLEMQKFRAGYFNVIFKTVENDLASAGIAVSSRWVADGRRLTTFKIRWRHEGLPTIRMEDRATKKRPPRIRRAVVAAPSETPAPVAASSVRPRRLQKPGAADSIEATPILEPAPAAVETPTAPPVATTKRTSYSRPRRLQPLSSAAPVQPSPEPAPKSAPPSPKPASKASRKASPDAWTRRAGETDDERDERWRACGPITRSRGADMFPDPTTEPDYDFVLRNFERIQQPHLFKISEDEWFDRLEREGVVVPRYTIPQPFHPILQYDPHFDKMFEEARRKAFDIDDDEDDEDDRQGW
ncbi:hypothetical protein [Methylosinus sp. PW1]|uniref:hypothetical protein n=1 Tax=Methylosinus sp. PW1 TaxID=107636 RepID=UPI0005663BBC|nr:hypothetical protein [Methylosinus sp. PW1]